MPGLESAVCAAFPRCPSPPAAVTAATSGLCYSSERKANRNPPQKGSAASESTRGSSEQRAAQCRSAPPEGHHTWQGKGEAPAAAAPPRRRRALVALLLTGLAASTRVPNARPPQPLDAAHPMNAGTSFTDKNSQFHHVPWSQILLKLIKFDIQKGTSFLSGSGCWFLATMVAGKRA
ncbi:uncharacterized protein LOC119315661 [Triticum dicoccoides]|uniref:uncharacterized protein LOC119315661 n=1 Tax=Triticum dicoccoides TaxID=85692 RepID=UPI00189191B0|nr:uncharacterized protein LOC119315661 [Triticum dicoccoides]